MSFGWSKFVLGALAALALGGAAQASNVTVTIRTNDADRPQRITEYGGGFVGHRYDEHRYDYRDPDRYYGRPVPEWRERRHHHGGYRGIQWWSGMNGIGLCSLGRVGTIKEAARSSSTSG
jgi:hypothetical protein